NSNNGVLGGSNPVAEPARVAGIVLSPTLTITPGDGGIETVTLVAYDVAGVSGVQTRTFTATDVPITVNTGTNAVVQQGATFTRTGSFTDAPGDGPRTATVDYGDGTGSQPLALNANQTFVLNHAFANAGGFSVTVTVTNQEGVSGSTSFNLTVNGFTVD